MRGVFQGVGDPEVVTVLAFKTERRLLQLLALDGAMELRFGEVWHGYDATSNRTFADLDSDEILVFNPARVIPVSAHWLHREGDDWDERFWLSGPIPELDLQVISARAREEEE